MTLPTLAVGRVKRSADNGVCGAFPSHALILTPPMAATSPDGKWSTGSRKEC